MKPKVLVMTKLYKESFVDLERYFDVIMPKEGMFTKELIKPYLKDIYALLPTYAFKVNKELIDSCPKLKIIANYGTGYDNIDFEYAGSKGIVVTNNPLPVVEPTAELAYALMLAAARKIVNNDNKIRKANIRINVLENYGMSLVGKTIGIIGLGRIGKTICRYAHASKMNIVYTQRKQLSIDEEKKLGAHYLTKDELLSVSDVITLHLPLSKDTFHYIGDKEFAKMKCDAILVNTARGAIVDELALIDALEKNKIGCAALDVFEDEPYISDELKRLPNVILSPHSGTATIDARIDMGKLAAQQIINFYFNKADLFRVN